MAVFFIYIIKSGFFLALFYLFFKWVMGRTTFFRMNRVMVLIGLCLCMFLPFVEVTIDNKPFQSPFHIFEEYLLSMDVPFNQNETVLPVTNETNPGNNELPISASPSYLSYFFTVFLIIYFIGIILTSVFVVVSFYRMFWLIHYSKKERFETYTLVLVSRSICPFSWGRYIVISESDYLQYPEIVMHEVMHLRFFHTADLLFMQLFLILHWFNPVIWLLKRELQEIHEYEADNGVINTGIDATRYQLLLVKKAVGTRLYSMANGFNHSKLKNRITMMLKEKTNKYARLRLLFLVPVMVGAIFVFARPEVSQVKELLVSEVSQLSQTEEVLDLKKEFSEKLAAYELQKFGRVLDEKEKEREYKDNYLLINGIGKILFNGEYAKTENVKSSIIQLVTNKKETEVITMIWDRSTDPQCIDEILHKAKEASVELEKNNSHPFLIYFGEPKSFWGNRH